MTRRTISVPVKGEATPRTSTLYSTIYGPMVAAPSSGLRWSAKTGYAMKDANSDDFRGGDAWLDISRAKSVAEIRAIITRTLGMPWVNTIAADRSGEALYADITSTPNVTAEKMKACAPALRRRADRRPQPHLHPRRRPLGLRLDGGGGSGRARPDPRRRHAILDPHRLRGQQQ